MNADQNYNYEPKTIPLASHTFGGLFRGPTNITLGKEFEIAKIPPRIGCYFIIYVGDKTIPLYDYIYPNQKTKDVELFLPWSKDKNPKDLAKFFLLRGADGAVSIAQRHPFKDSSEDIVYSPSTFKNLFVKNTPCSIKIIQQPVYDVTAKVYSSLGNNEFVIHDEEEFILTSTSKGNMLLEIQELQTRGKTDLVFKVSAVDDRIIQLSTKPPQQHRRQQETFDYEIDTSELDKYGGPVIFDTGDIFITNIGSHNVPVRTQFVVKRLNDEPFSFDF